MIQGVTVIGDLLRPDGQGNPGGADRPTTWLYNALRRQVALATSLPVGLLTTDSLPGLPAALAAERSFDRAALVWAGCYQSLPEGSLFHRHALPALRRQFCIAYEMPPYLKAVLDTEKVPYIDLRIHPVRFLDDLMFAARSPDPDVQAALGGMAVAESEVITTAGLRQAMCQMITNAALPSDTLLVLGQRPMDSTQIIGGRFFDAINHKERIAACCAGHRAVLLKPHPQERDHSLMTVAAGVAGNVIGVTGDNLYRLLSLPQIAAVLTVNSSAAYEVSYFGPRLETLAPLPVRLAWAGEDPDLATHVSVDDRVLTPDFWRMVLASHARVTPCDGMTLKPKPNRLRIALDSFWNYQEIDTDRIPGRPRAG